MFHVKCLSVLCRYLSPVVEIFGLSSGMFHVKCLSVFVSLSQPSSRDFWFILSGMFHVKCLSVLCRYLSPVVEIFGLSSGMFHVKCLSCVVSLSQPSCRDFWFILWDVPC